MDDNSTLDVPPYFDRLTPEEIGNSVVAVDQPVPDAPPSKGTELSSQLVSIPLAALDPNPYRNLGGYPFIERKVAALKRSIGDVGLWEGVIARKVADRYQTAFGHHRIEAARRFGLTEATIILRDLDNKQMPQFMGRENMEDYNADFLTMLQTWDAAVQHLESGSVNNPQAIEITRLLGWTQTRPGGGDQMSRTAEACNSTHKLLQDGELKREDLADLTVSQAREILTRASANTDRIIKTAKTHKHSVTQVNAAKKQIGKAVVQTAKEANRGQVAQKDLRGRVDIHTYRFAREAKRRSPLFAQFGKQLANNIGKMFESDAANSKLKNIQSSLPDLTLNEDFTVIRLVDFELGELAKRASKWRTRLSIDSHKQAEAARRGVEG